MRQLLLLTVPVLLALALAACDAVGPKDQQAIVNAPPPAQVPEADPQADALTAAIQAQSDLLAEASSAPGSAATATAPPVAHEVMWLTPASDTGSSAPAPTTERRGLS
ncbi:MAG: hypothetical protein IT445_09225 [Phycisphaeraceae bacterium]|nr:hypothetical protein [Phycisphaeraceae bacterium]